MSYCRFSTDDFQCDLYCYECVHGEWVTHVAGNRLVLAEPLPPKVDFPRARLLNRLVWKLFPGRLGLKMTRYLPRGRGFDAYLQRHKKVQDIVERSKHVDIDLPHAGDSFRDHTLEDFLRRVLYLRSLGYNCPDDVIYSIVEEMKAWSESA